MHNKINEATVKLMHREYVIQNIGRFDKNYELKGDKLTTKLDEPRLEITYDLSNDYELSVIYRYMMLRAELEHLAKSLNNK